MSDVATRIRDEVTQNDVVLFMKGTPVFPQCGFSAATVEVLGGLPALAGAEMGLSTPQIGSRIAEIVREGRADAALVPDSLLGVLAAVAPSRL